jgi:flagellar protein FlaI
MFPFRIRKSKKRLKEAIQELESKYDEEKQEKQEDLSVFLNENADMPIEEINVTYPVIPPFQFANIRYDPAKNDLVYSPAEPVLTKKEGNYLSTISLLLENIRVDPDVLLENKEEHLRKMIAEIMDKYGMQLSEFQREKITYLLAKEYTGNSWIEVPMNDRYIEDISCNGAGVPLYIYHRIFESIRTNVTIPELELNRFVLKLAQSCGKYISIAQPITDASLPDGSRLNLTLGTEVTKKGSTFTIRKFKRDPISPVELIRYGSASSELFAFLWVLLQYNRSVLVSGSTAAGKTTFLNALCMFLRQEAKIVSIEDTPEINIFHDNWIQSVTRVGFGRGSGSSDVSGISGISKSSGDIALYDLLAASLRQRPDYIIVGEVRGSEAYTMFQAISVGHPSLGTVHSGSLPELLSRLESQPMNVPRALISSLDSVVFASIVPREREGSDMRKVRRVKSVVEVLDLSVDTGDLLTNEVITWDPVDDRFVFGKSFIFDSIQQEFGVKERYLKEEVMKRSAVLDYMYERNITDFRDVTKVVQEYYIKPDDTYAMAREALDT